MISLLTLQRNREAIKGCLQPVEQAALCWLSTQQSQACILTHKGRHWNHRIVMCLYLYDMFILNLCYKLCGGMRTMMDDLQNRVRHGDACYMHNWESNYGRYNSHIYTNVNPLVSFLFIRLPLPFCVSFTATSFFKYLNNSSNTVGIWCDSFIQQTQKDMQQCMRRIHGEWLHLKKAVPFIFVM